MWKVKSGVALINLQCLWSKYFLHFFFLLMFWKDTREKYINHFSSNPCVVYPHNRFSLHLTSFLCLNNSERKFHICCSFLARYHTRRVLGVLKRGDPG